MFTGRRPRRFSVSAVLTPAILGQARQGRKMQLPVEPCVLYSWPQKAQEAHESPEIGRAFCASLRHSYYG
jgi:hypothetical protein